MLSTMNILAGRSVYRRSPDVVCREVGLESILVPIRHNVGNLDFVYTLSPVAARIWSMLDGTLTVEAIVDELCSEYDVERETATSDVHQLLADLEETGLISKSS